MALDEHLGCQVEARIPGESDKLERLERGTGAVEDVVVDAEGIDLEDLGADLGQPLRSFIGVCRPRVLGQLGDDGYRRPCRNRFFLLVNTYKI